MPPRNITPSEAGQLTEQIVPMLAYLGRLQQRMEACGMTDDSLYPLVRQAYDRVHHLRVMVHYRSCDKSVSVGYPPSVSFAPHETTAEPPASH